MKSPDVHDVAANLDACLPLETKPFGKVFGVRDPDGGARFVLELSASKLERRFDEHTSC